MKDISNKGLSSSARQSQEVEQFAKTIDQISMTINDISHNASTAAVSTHHANKEAETANSLAHETVVCINGLAEDIGHIFEVINNVEKDTKNISNVLSVIRSISEQTNLLALNAAIESVRAGEAGRGFAVVADEVRQLATKTQQSTVEIQEIIQSLESGASNSVQMMKEGLLKAETSVAQANKTGGSLESIVKEISTINDINSRIASSTEELNTVAGSITQNVTDLNELSKENGQSAEVISSSSVSLSQLAEMISSLIKQFKT